MGLSYAKEYEGLRGRGWPRDESANRSSGK